MRSIGSVFGDHPEYYETTETSAARLRQVLRGKAVLIVLDDIWDRHHIEPFLTGESRSRTLFTSRDRTIAISLGAKEVRLGRLTPRNAVEILQKWTGRNDREFNEIAEYTRYIPIALKLAGALLRAGMTTSEWLRKYRSSPLQMKIGYREQSDKDDLTRCFDLSLERYDPKERRFFYALGIFPEDLRIPFAVAKRLWQKMEPTLGEDYTRELLSDFVRMELLDIDDEYAIGLHDLMQGYALEKLAGDAVFRHCDLLDSYAHETEQYWDVEDDGYFFRYAGHHFVRGHREKEWRELLGEFRWIRAKLQATEPAALIEDYNSLPHSADHEAIRSAIRLSAHVLSRNRRQLVTQLTGRLVGHLSPIIKRLLSDAAQQTAHPWLRPLWRSLRSGDGPLVGTLLGHNAGVSTVLFAPDEASLISGSFDGTIKIWDWRRGIE